MFRIVPGPWHPDYERHFAIRDSYEVDPAAEFEPGMIEQLGVVGNKIIAVETGREVEIPEKKEPEEESE